MASAPLTRGAQFNAYARTLLARHELDRVLPSLPPATRALLDSPPDGSDWIPLEHNVALFAAVEATLGPGRVRALARETSRGPLFAPVRTFVEMALATFGGTPATLFARAETLLRFNIRGQEIRYTPWTERSGELAIRVCGLRPPPSFFEAWAGITESVFDLCGIKGTVECHPRDEPGEDGRAVLRVAW
jgi:hypothetical protein